MPEFETMQERELVEAARRDPDAFAELYRRYVERIHGFALRRTGSRAVAEDVTSATFERALAKLHRFRWRSDGFSPWLHRLAANEIADHHRGRARHRTDRAQTTLARHHVGSAPAADVTVGLDVDRDHVRAAVGRLSPRHQQVLSLAFFADLDAAEASAAMTMSKRSFAVALHRAKAALRDELEKGGAR